MNVAKFIKHSQKGDTIVEVLIAIAVASSVLAIAYSTMNRNLLTVRDNQERTEATKIAQGQIELFKSFRDGGGVIPSGPYCLESDALGVISTNGGFINSAPSSDIPDNFNNYPPGKCASGFYHYATVPGTDAGTYIFYVRWDKVNGNGQDQVMMAYR